MPRDDLPDRIMEAMLEGAASADFERRVLEAFSPDAVVGLLADVLTPERKERIEAVIAGRTHSVVTVVEGVLNTGNVSAVMRTAEGLGFQELHVITKEEPFKHSERTTTGAEKWLDVFVWKDASACVRHLKEHGFRVIAAHPDASAAPIDSIDFVRPTALVFGNELEGVTARMLALCDGACMLPVAGFVQSYNISVAAAMALYYAHRQRTEHLGSNGDLAEDEKWRLRARFYVRAATGSRQIISRALDAGETSQGSSIEVAGGTPGAAGS